MQSIKVMLVDDHQVVREGLRRMLELEHDIQVVGEAPSAEEALAAIDALQPDIVLMDIKMPGVGGIEGVRRVKAKHPECKVVMLTLYEEYIGEAMKAGAAGYILKDVDREELTRAIRRAYQGKTPISALDQQVFSGIAGLFSGPDQSSLSERELAILRLIANGATTRDIGEELFLSEATVKRDVQRIFDKLDVRNRSEAVAEAYRRKLITGPERPERL